MALHRQANTKKQNTTSNNNSIEYYKLYNIISIHF